MTFDEKIEYIENARILYSSFDEEFKEFLATGQSPNGAYNHFSIEDIEKHKIINNSLQEQKLWHVTHGSIVRASPVKLKEHSIITTLENLNESISNPSRG